jgi:hypothetical protein
MGCGKADRFLFHNYDNQSGGDEMIQEVDISELSYICRDCHNVSRVMGYKRKLYSI